MSQKFIKFETRDDDVKMITDALKYIPIAREDIWGYLCYLRNEIAEQQEIKKSWGVSDPKEADAFTLINKSPKLYFDAETLIWLYQSYITELLREIENYKHCYGDTESKEKTK
ncbi:hypothetical protein [Alkaliphilus sp. B6464]|uniref:hypothetical protein n=1 Tax=Alkaliphilus sp. B6464 TaxID=2731219 RepID=UPI001BA8B4A5|nr:hypothetical protein [Alkaliphilus sp. B6464]QUH21843.1 hypothetical protein HYG84_18070 [Alkaliphilus sp. B6464]